MEINERYGLIYRCQESGVRSQKTEHEQRTKDKEKRSLSIALCILLLAKSLVQWLDRYATGAEDGYCTLERPNSMIKTPFFAPAELATDGMTIRTYRPGDGPALQVAVVSSYEHLRPWMPWADANQTVEQSEANCRRFAANYLLNQDFVLGIWIADDLAGGTGYHLRGGSLDTGNAEIGMWIRGSYAGQGLGTRVLRALLEWGFSEWGWERLSWHCDTRNIASARVAEKNGLTREGTLRSDAFDVAGQRRDTHVYAMLRDEWLRRNAVTGHKR